MPETIELALRPSAPNSLAWSVDGELAIAAEARVQLLIPKIGATSDDEEWDRIHFEIGSFAPHEWIPLENPQGSAKDLFIAREQRPSEVMALQWSAPGLASHDKCVLGVLTSNGFVSVLSPGASVQSAASWFRTTIISYRKPGKIDERILVINGEVRAFAWVPEPLCARPHFRLVVMTDTAVYIIRISNKADHVTRKIENRVSVPAEAPAESLREEVDWYQFGCHLTWSVPDAAEDDVSTEGGGHVKTAYLVVAFRGRIRQIAVTQDLDHLEEHPSLKWTEGSLPGYGPIALSSNRLYYVHDDQICSLPYSPKNFSTLTREVRITSALDGWDMPIAMTPFHNGVASQQYLTLASYTQHCKDSSQSTYFSERNGSRLSRELARYRQEYSEDHELHQRVATRMHGLATLTDLNTNKKWLAVVVTFAPSEQIQYKLPNAERATIVFTHEDHETGEQEMTDEELQYPWAKEPTMVGADIVLTQVLNLMPRLELHPTKQSKQIALLHVFAQHILQSPAKQWRKAMDILKSLDSGAWEEAAGKFSRTTMGKASGVEMVNRLIRETTEQEHLSGMLELCSIPGCGAHLEFLDGSSALETATCAGAGHRFDRCALTLLAITQPYVSKECERCSRTCFDEDKVGEDWDAVKAIVGNAKRCQYCEGKFYG